MVLNEFSKGSYIELETESSWNEQTFKFIKHYYINLDTRAIVDPNGVQGELNLRLSSDDAPLDFTNPILATKGLGLGLGFGLELGLGLGLGLALTQP